MGTLIVTELMSPNSNDHELGRSRIAADCSQHCNVFLKRVSEMPSLEVMYARFL